MHILIVGVGNVGYYLSKSLISNDEHTITLIEKDHPRSVVVADRLDISVIHGDGSKISTLEKANAKRANILVALTGKDEDNFICCQIAKTAFKIPTVIAKANNPENVEIMKSLSADIVISSADMLANIIEKQVNAVDYHFITHLTTGDTSIVEFEVVENTTTNNKKISEINWPSNTLVITIIREGKSIVPSGQSVLKVGDKVTISTKNKNENALKKLFI